MAWPASWLTILKLSPHEPANYSKIRIWPEEWEGRHESWFFLRFPGTRLVSYMTSYIAKFWERKNNVESCSPQLAWSSKSRKLGGIARPDARLVQSAHTIRQIGRA